MLRDNVAIIVFDSKDHDEMVHLKVGTKYTRVGKILQFLTIYLPHFRKGARQSHLFIYLLMYYWIAHKVHKRYKQR